MQDNAYYSEPCLVPTKKWIKCQKKNTFRARVQEVKTGWRRKERTTKGREGRKRERERKRDREGERIKLKFHYRKRNAPIIAAL